MQGSTEAATEIEATGRALIERGAFESIRVLRVDGELATDPDRDAVVRLRLTLSNPREGVGTWPLEELDVLQDEVERLAAAAQLPYVVMEFYPEADEPGDDSAAADADLERALDRDAGR